MSLLESLRIATFISIGDWPLILSLIFGGCCSNAWALELAASQNRNLGSVLTFAQFILVSLLGLPKHLCIVSKATSKPKGNSEAESPSSNDRIEEPFQLQKIWRQPTLLSHVRLKKRAIPISRWMIQVVLFLLTSLMNNAVFAYRVPMAIHIIFRSAGLVTNLLLGWLWSGKRYSRAQVISVLIVTLGVVLTTVSSKPRKSQVSTTSSSDNSATFEYMIGVIILALALVLSSAMGIAQDITYEKYGRGHWQEGMFYLHFLALPMFVPLVSDIQEQVRVINQSPPVSLATGLEPLGFIFIPPKSRLYYIISAISIPRYWIPLILNILTSFVCVSGVHRLTAKVSSLTVTLVLAVRKAVSLVISVILINGGKGDEWLWIGGLFVLAGTVLYAWDGQKSKGQSKVKKVD